jgi:hypothetical protein
METMFDRSNPPAPGPVVWVVDEPTTPIPRPVALDHGHHLAGWNDSSTRRERSARPDPTIIRHLKRPLSWLGARLIAAPGDDLRQWNSIDVTCRVKRSATEAVAAVGRTDAIVWGDGRRPSRLSIEAIRHERSALGGPRLADAVIRGRRTGEIGLTIAIFEGNRDTCFVQLRRNGRTAWGIRRRRRCMTATHDAADRLVEQILAVDFRPPADPATQHALA